MSPYDISISPDEAGQEYRVVLHGPGIDSEGRPYVFATAARCEKFIRAVNFAYEQGIREGQRRALESMDERLVYVTGRTPEALVLRREPRWLSVIRACRSFFRRG